jgi:putative FmdB family regulatory protein
MPTYDYECKECGEKKEVFQKMDDPAPECHDKPMTRLVGAPWVRRGAGIYSMDVENKKLGEWKEK